MPRDYTEGFAQLLGSSRLRRHFRANPEACMDDLDLDPTHRGRFAALNPDAIDEQARVLLRKRFHEVAGLLPKTCAALGPRAYGLFENYAEGFWPKGHLRHATDAVAFFDALRGAKVPGLQTTEFYRVLFVLRRRRWQLRWLGRQQPGLHLLWRGSGDQVREVVWRF